MNIGAFNLGNAIGAAVGGGVIAAGIGYPAVALAGAAASGLGLVAVIVARHREPKRDRRPPDVAIEAAARSANA